MSSRSFCLAIIGIMMLLSSIIATPAKGQEQPHVGTYKLQLQDGMTYDILYTAINTTLQSIEIHPYTLEIIIKLENTTYHGRLSLQIPRDVIDRTMNIGNLVVFIDEVTADYTESETTCNYRTILIDDIPSGSEEIVLVGSYADDPSEPKTEAELDINISGKKYSIFTSTISKICDWEFIPEEKRLVVHSDSFERMHISSIETEMLGAPYTVVADGQQIAFNHSSYANGTLNSISITSDKPIKTLEIIGTTAIPEFGSSFAVVIGVLSLSGTILAHRALIHMKRKL